MDGKEGIIILTKQRDNQLMIRKQKLGSVMYVSGESYIMYNI